VDSRRSYEHVRTRQRELDPRGNFDPLRRFEKRVRYEQFFLRPRSFSGIFLGSERPDRERRIVLRNRAGRDKREESQDRMSLYPRNANGLSKGTLVSILDLFDRPFFVLCLDHGVFLGPTGQIYSDILSSEKLQALLEDRRAFLVE